MVRNLFSEELLRQITEVVAQLAAWNNVRPGAVYFTETVREYNASGSEIGYNCFTCNQYDLSEHIEKARSLGCNIDIANEKITVTRELRSGGKFIAEYVPIKGLEYGKEKV